LGRLGHWSWHAWEGLALLELRQKGLHVLGVQLLVGKLG
jgi:hypothetical protein